jgi:hypothetical protein
MRDKKVPVVLKVVFFVSGAETEAGAAGNPRGHGGAQHRHLLFQVGRMTTPPPPNVYALKGPLAEVEQSF